MAEAVGVVSHLTVREHKMNTKTVDFDGASSRLDPLQAERLVEGTLPD